MVYIRRIGPDRTLAMNRTQLRILSCTRFLVTIISNYIVASKNGSFCLPARTHCYPLKMIHGLVLVVIVPVLHSPRLVLELTSASSIRIRLSVLASRLYRKTAYMECFHNPETQDLKMELSKVTMRRPLSFGDCLTQHLTIGFRVMVTVTGAHQTPVSTRIS
jgi:hypothetical protein